MTPDSRGMKAETKLERGTSCGGIDRYWYSDVHVSGARESLTCRATAALGEVSEVKLLKVK
jgi:hypothetical protein